LGAACDALVGRGLEDFQVREEHWVIADLIGKGKHIRTVPVPVWAKRAVDEWIDAAKIGTGALFRRVVRLGKIWGSILSARTQRFEALVLRVGLPH
jgi:site-specific recombinase XerC